MTAYVKMVGGVCQMKSVRQIRIMPSDMLQGSDKILLVSEEEYARIKESRYYRPTASEVKDLRDRTGYGMMSCKKALTVSEGDMVAATDWLIRRCSI